MKILFLGDSITDVGRNREDPASLGSGYPLFISGRLAVRQPGEFTCRNTGISGDRSVDIYARIKKDCWNIQPDFISLLMGINDVWHEIGAHNGVGAERFYRMCRMLVEDTVERLPGVKILLMEPFVLPGSGTSGNWETFARELPLRVQAVKQVAGEMHTLYLPLQEMFERACEKQPPEYWLMDGVHPTAAGHQLIADAWLALFDREVPHRP